MAHHPAAHHLRHHGHRLPRHHRLLLRRRQSRQCRQRQIWHARLRRRVRRAPGHLDCHRGGLPRRPDEQGSVGLDVQRSGEQDSAGLSRSRFQLLLQLSGICRPHPMFPTWFPAVVTKPMSDRLLVRLHRAGHPRPRDGRCVVPRMAPKQAAEDPQRKVHAAAAVKPMGCADARQLEYASITK